jgi:hypothetical protein
MDRTHRGESTEQPRYAGGRRMSCPDPAAMNGVGTRQL